MATIEERATQCCMTKFPSHETADAESMRQGYIIGATEQRKIDINKACEWLKQCTTFEHPDYRHPVPYFDDEDIEEFKKIMLE